MSWSESSLSRKSSWAVTSDATVSSIGVVTKTKRSLSMREKMSNARSPRLVCSITVGTINLSIPAPRQLAADFHGHGFLGIVGSSGGLIGHCLSGLGRHFLTARYDFYQSLNCTLSPD